MQSNRHEPEIKEDGLSTVPENAEQFHTLDELNHIQIEIEQLLKDYFAIETLPTIDDIEFHDCKDEIEVRSASQTPLNGDSLAVATQHAECALAYFTEGFSTLCKSDLALSLSYYKLALSVSLNAIKNNNVNGDSETHSHYKLIANALHYLAMLSNHATHYAQAFIYNKIELMIRTTIQVQTKIKDSLTPVALLHMGNINHKKNNFDYALQFFDYALNLSLAHFGESHCSVGRSLYFKTATYHQIAYLSLLSAQQALEKGDLERAEIIIQDLDAKFKCVIDSLSKAEEFYSTFEDSEIQKNLDDISLSMTRGLVTLNQVKNKTKENLETLKHQQIPLHDLLGMVTSVIADIPKEIVTTESVATKQNVDQPLKVSAPVPAPPRLTTSEIIRRTIANSHSPMQNPINYAPQNRPVNFLLSMPPHYYSYPCFHSQQRMFFAPYQKLPIPSPAQFTQFQGNLHLKYMQSRRVRVLHPHPSLVMVNNSNQKTNTTAVQPTSTLRPSSGKR